MNSSIINFECVSKAIFLSVMLSALGICAVLCMSDHQSTITENNLTKGSETNTKPSPSSWSPNGLSTGGETESSMTSSSVSNFGFVAILSVIAALLITCSVTITSTSKQTYFISNQIESETFKWTMYIDNAIIQWITENFKKRKGVPQVISTQPAQSTIPDDSGFLVVQVSESTTYWEN